MMKLNRRYLKSKIVLSLLLITLAIFDFTKLNDGIHEKSHAYLTESIKLAAGTYATSRMVNGGVSTIQESSVSISPWGVGITTEFQFLDPINDATERLSDVTVSAMALLATQKLILYAINKYTIIPFYILSFLLIIFLFFEKANYFKFRAVKYALLLLLLRASIPLMCEVGIRTNENYFKPQAVVHEETLGKVHEIAFADLKDSIPTNSRLHSGHDDGWTDKISNFLNYTSLLITNTYREIKHRAASLSRAVVYLKDNFDEVSESLAGLFILLIEKILVQVFLLPLSTLFIIRFIFKKCTGGSLKGLIEHLSK